MKIISVHKGFTLIELLLVVSIIAVLMAMLLPAIEAVQRAGFINETRNRLAIISGAISQYENTYDGMIRPAMATTTQGSFGKVIQLSRCRSPQGM